jgi:hypothetical protein
MPIRINYAVFRNNPQDKAHEPIMKKGRVIFCKKTGKTTKAPDRLPKPAGASS